MPQFSSFFSIAFLALLLAFLPGNEHNDPIEIGQAAPMTDVEMAGTDGMNYTLDAAKGENGLLVIFSCNTCPFVIAWEHRYNEVHKFCQENKVGMIVLNSNEAKREGADSMEEMKGHASDQTYTFPYVIDTNHKIADAFGAAKTPDVFLFDNEMNLAYKGALDDSGGRGEMTTDYMTKAISNMVAGKPIDPNYTKAIGCTIKRL